MQVWEINYTQILRKKNPKENKAKPHLKEIKQVNRGFRGGATMETYKFYLISLSLTWLVYISNAEHVQHAPCESNPGIFWHLSLSLSLSRPLSLASNVIFQFFSLHYQHLISIMHLETNDSLSIVHLQRILSAQQQQQQWRWRRWKKWKSIRRICKVFVG